jgi:predicted AAA+ superfamily ATPase
VPPVRWYPGYVQTYLERDVRQLKQVENLTLFKTFMQMCAGRIGQVLNLTSLGNDVGVSDATVRRWITLLEASYIVFVLRPHHNNLNKRLIKSPKLYFYDTGLASFLLNIDENSIAQHHLRGGLFENLLIGDFYKRFYNQGKIPPLYFWRDRTGHEIDLLMDRGIGAQPIEIKAGRTISHSFFKNVRYWAELAGADEKESVVIYAGDENQKRSAGRVVSWKDVDDISITF